MDPNDGQRHPPYHQQQQQQHGYAAPPPPPPRHIGHPSPSTFSHASSSPASASPSSSGYHQSYHHQQYDPAVAMTPSNSYPGNSSYAASPPLLPYATGNPYASRNASVPFLPPPSPSSPASFAHHGYYSNGYEDPDGGSPARKKQKQQGSYPQPPSQQQYRKTSLSSQKSREDVSEKPAQAAGASSSTPNKSGQVFLKKQQACLTCKRRKTKCDAVRPICGACKRSQARAARGHALTAEVPPGPCTFPDDPATEDRATPKSARNGSISGAQGNGHDASYSDPRKSADASSSASAGSSTTPNSNSNAFVSPTSGTPASRLPNKHSSPQSQSGAAPGRSFVEIHSASGGPAKIQRFYQWSVSGDHPGMNLSNLVNPVIDPQLGGTGAAKEEESSPQVDLLLRQMWPDLSPDLPTPTTIRHMAELFFSKHPLANMFVKPTMLARLMLPPNHPLRPHPSLLHAILAAAEPYSPLVPAMQDSNPLFPTGAAASGGAAEGSFPGFAPFDPQQSDSARAARVETSGRGFVGISNPMEMPRPDISKSLSFGEFHLGKARREVEVALLTQNQRPLEWLQAGVLIEYCLLERCRIMEAFFLSAALVRTLAPTGLDKMPNERQSDWWHRSLFGPPVSSILEYEQRMAVWQVYLCDTYGAGPPKFYEPCIADEKAQLTTTMPILMDPVEDDSALLLSEQTLASQDLFRSGHTDVFSVHVKSAVLLKRARTITSRRGIELQRMARPPEDILEIDRNAQDFIKTFPKREEREFDVDWIVAEANVCTARITLHQYFVGTGLDPTSEYGRGPIEQATETMLRTIHLLLASSFDFHLLHTQTFVCWTVLIRVLDVKLRTLQRLPAALVAITGLAAGEIEKTRDSIEGVLAALTKAGTKSWRAKTSLDVSKTALEGDLTDDEFADMLFLYTTIPT